MPSPAGLRVIEDFLDIVHVPVDHFPSGLKAPPLLALQL
jgi:hypothetical protein